MDFSAYPNFSFKLDCGRTVRVDAFIWQPSYQEQLDIKSKKGTETIKIERNQDLYWRLFGKCPVHVVNAEYVDQYINHPPRLPNSAVTVLLSSEPLSSGVYSELVVELYADYAEALSMKDLLEQYLHDLDWEKWADDVSDHESRPAKKAWLDQAIH